MYKVLIIDDDPMVLAHLKKGLQKYDSQFDAIFASDGEDAIEILKSQSISVMVTDLVMPNVGGLDLLAYKDRYYPRIQCIVMTSHGSEDFKKSADKEDAFHYIEKPVDYNVLAWTILDAIDTLDEGGIFARVSVASLLQLVEIEDKTCHLKIKHNRNETGSFYFVRGILWDANCGDMQGEDATLKMIGWEHVDFKFEKLPNNEISQKIDKSIMYLLMEGKRLKDEQEEKEREANEPENNTHEKPGELSEDLFETNFSDQLDDVLGDVFELDDDDEQSDEDEQSPDQAAEENKAEHVDALIEDVVKDEARSRMDKDSSDGTTALSQDQIKEHHAPAETAIESTEKESQPDRKNDSFQHQVQEYDLISEAIQLAEGHYFEPAKKALVQFLKTHPKSSKGWIWYSRVSGNMKAVESALNNAALISPKDPAVVEEVEKFRLAKKRVQKALIRHCPFCWAPVEDTFTECLFCKSHLQIHGKFFVSNRPANQEIIEKAIKRYERVINREKNPTANFYLGMAHLNLEQWEQGLDRIIEACEQTPESAFFAQQQKALMTFMASIETMPQHEVYTRKSDTGTDTVPLSPINKNKILVVEDSAVTRKVITMALTQNGYEVAQTKNGPEALTYIETNRPDLILLDIIMPGIDGYQVLTAMKQQQWMKNVPVIMLTAMGKLIDKLKGKMAGASEYLTKPFDPDELIEIVEKYL